MTLPNYPDPTSPPPGQTPDPAQPAYPVQPGYAPPPGYPPYQAYAYAPVRPTNGMAIASLVTSIAALLVCYGLPGIVGALLGHSARRQIRERGEDGAGLALAGIIVGWIGFGLFMLAVVALIIFIVAVENSSSSSYSTYD